MVQFKVKGRIIIKYLMFKPSKSPSWFDRSVCI